MKGSLDEGLASQVQRDCLQSVEQLGLGWLKIEVYTQ